MAKLKSTFVCQNCGTVQGRWQGRCEGCGEWNTIVEETGAIAPPVAAGGARIGRGRVIALEGLSGTTVEALACPRAWRSSTASPAAASCAVGAAARRRTRHRQVDALIQAAAALAQAGQRVVYISGEEAVAQVRLRAARLGLAQATVEIAAETHVDDIVATLQAGPAPALCDHRFIQDHVDERGRGRARHRDAGARLGRRL